MTLHLDSNRISGHGWPEICWLHMLEICRMLVAYELLEMSSFTHKGCSPYYNFASPLRMCLLTLVTVVAAKPCDAVAANSVGCAFCLLLIMSLLLEVYVGFTYVAAALCNPFPVPNLPRPTQLLGLTIEEQVCNIQCPWNGDIFFPQVVAACFAALIEMSTFV